MPAPRASGASSLDRRVVLGLALGLAPGGPALAGTGSGRPDFQAGDKEPSPLWMVAKSISHHFETMGNQFLLVFTGESSFQGCLGGAGFRPSTVGPPVVPFLTNFFGWEGSPTKIDYRKKLVPLFYPLYWRT